jgi:hypothetical protein
MQDAQKGYGSHPPSPLRAETRVAPSEGLSTPYRSS